MEFLQKEVNKLIMTDKMRERIIAHTIEGTYYEKMELIKHKIEKIIKRFGVYIIYKGELWFEYNRTKVHIYIRSDRPSKKCKERIYGYIESVETMDFDEEEYSESSGYCIREMVR